MINSSKKLIKISSSNPLTKRQALKIVESSYLSAASSLIWIALYYLPIGGAVFRLALPLPLILLQQRRGFKSAYEGLILAVLLLVVLMGPFRGPLILFPYGLLSLWLGWTWSRGFSWWISWPVGVLIGTTGFLIRVAVLSLLVGENLWVIITRAGSSLLERIINVLNLPFNPEIIHVQLMAIGLVILQEIIYVLCLHALAFWIFPRLKVCIPEPPNILRGLILLDNQ